MATITEHVVQTAEHQSFYLASGPETGPPIIMCHGWPELSLSWRHQLQCLGDLGFRAIAPDMRGYGRSTIYPCHEDYALEHTVGDMIDLVDSLGIEKAVWVGHDWGAAVVWSIASHHPERCHAVANLCVPYATLERGYKAMLPLVDRALYPEDEYPYGQWDYQAFYEEDFAGAIKPFDANPTTAVKVVSSKGMPAMRGKVWRNATIRRDGGWFGGAPEAPDLPLDTGVLTEADLSAYAAALTRNGFFGPASWYMNHEANARYAEQALNSERLDMPVLFLIGQYDYTCECIDSDLARPMRGLCTNLTEHTVPSGHWMAQEKPVEVNAALVHWLATRVSAFWPLPTAA
ncbi:MAG: alpha/beta hydrolase [Burkholderiaceae bacterium]